MRDGGRNSCIQHKARLAAESAGYDPAYASEIGNIHLGVRNEDVQRQAHCELGESHEKSIEIWSGIRTSAFKRDQFGRPGQASADAYRRLFVRKLSVQHSEGS
jgi:hypothetical protein